MAHCRIVNCLLVQMEAVTDTLSTFRTVRRFERVPVDLRLPRSRRGHVRPCRRLTRFPRPRGRFSCPAKIGPTVAASREGLIRPFSTAFVSISRRKQKTAKPPARRPPLIWAACSKCTRARTNRLSESALRHERIAVLFAFWPFLVVQFIWLFGSIPNR